MRELVLDISKWDPDIDLQAWKYTHGLWGVIIKFGGNEGGRYKDSCAEKHYANAVAAGLHIGAYFYTTVTTVSEAIDDAKYFSTLLAGKKFDMPVYMDVEDYRQMNLSPDALTNVITAFCDTMTNLGYYSGIYTMGSAWHNNMHRDQLYKYANWIARWGKDWPYQDGDIGMWQQGTMDFTSGNIFFDDVSGCTDCNWCAIDYPTRINGPKVITPTQEETEPVDDSGLFYRAHVQSTGWLEPVRDGQQAGTTGFAARLEALKIRPTEDMGELEVEVYVHDKGWLKYSGIKYGEASGTESSDIDPIIGTIGEGRAIEAIKITTKNCKLDKKLRYTTHVERIGWTDPVWEGNISGVIGNRIEAIRIWFDNEEIPVTVVKEEKTGRTTDVIDIAFGELGYYAPDDPERGSKYGRWLADLTGEDWLAGPSNEIFWCCMFASWCLAQAGVEMDGFPTQNTDLALNGGAKKYAVDKYDVRYGDIVIFNWDWDGTTDHIGFATGEFDGTGFPTIEGNVGNAVKEKYRQMGNVAWVLRPPYLAYGVHSGTQTSVNIEPRNNRDGGELEVDGIGGWNTIIDWQHQLRVIEDGWIDGQDRDNAGYFKGISNVKFNEIGSKLIATVQAQIGASVDGIWGKETSVKLQEWLNKNGYSCAVDGDFGKESVKALQRSLNDKKWQI